MPVEKTEVLTIELSRKGHHLIFTLTSFEDGFGEQKRALMPIDYQNFDGEELVEKAKEHKWQFSDKADASGWFRVTKAA